MYNGSMMIDDIVEAALSNERETKANGEEFIGAWDAAAVYAEPHGYSEIQFRSAMLRMFPGVDPSVRFDGDRRVQQAKAEMRMARAYKPWANKSSLNLPQ